MNHPITVSELVQYLQTLNPDAPFEIYDVVNYFKVDPDAKVLTMNNHSVSIVEALQQSQCFSYADALSDLSQAMRYEIDDHNYHDVMVLADFAQHLVDDQEQTEDYFYQDHENPQIVTNKNAIQKLTQTIKLSDQD